MVCRVRLAVAALVLVLCGCNPFASLPPGEAEPLPANPCYDVNLLDGLSEEGPEELRALYECFNVDRGFDGAEGVVHALETETTRSGENAAVEFARFVNRLPGEVDVVATVREASRLLQERDEFLVHAVHTLAEWTYGRPWPEVEVAYGDGGGVFLEPSAVEIGLVQPLVPMVGVLASASLDGGDLPDIAAALGELTAMPELADTLDTLAYLVETQEAELFAHVADDTGAYLEASPGPGGRDTLLALLEAAVTPSAGVAGATPIEAALPIVDRILDDAVVTQRLVGAVGDLYLDGELLGFPNQLHGMLEIDAAGGSLEADELSALEALVRLLDLTNGPVSCWPIQVDNLAVFILETMAEWQPSTVETASLLLVDLLQPLLIPAGWVCDGVGPELADYMPSIVRLAESGAMRTLIPLLAAAKGDTGPNRVADVVDLLSIIEQSALMPPIAAHARQELSLPFIGNVLQIVGAYVAPQGAVAGDIDTVLAIVDFVISPRGGGARSSLLGLLQHPIRDLIGREEARLADWLQRWAVVLQADGSASNRFLYKVAPLLAIDPDLDLIAGIGRVMANDEMNEPLFRLMDTPGFVEALGASAAPDGREGLLGLGGRFAADGSLESLLAILRWGADTLDSIGLLPEGDDDDSGAP